MKTLKLATAGLLSMLAINVASASTEIRLTGSTAFRKATVNSIQNVLNSDYVWGSTGGSGLGASQQVFVGTTKTTGVQVIIKCSWSGSAGGIQSLAQNVPAGQPFIIDPTGVAFGPAAGTVGGIALTHAGANIPTGADISESHTADVALSDAFPSTTPYTGAGFTALKDTVVGIVPFAWVKGAYTPDGTVASAVAGGLPGVTNITLDQAQQLIGGGLALNQFTGNPSDQAVFVQLVDRDHDSGTRVGYIYDSQYLGCIFGKPTDGYNDGILQYLPQGNGTTGTSATVGTTQFASQTPGTGVISSLTPWPTETVIGENRPAGNEGFFSGGTVASVLNRPCDTSAGNYIISFLGFGDSPSVNPGAGYSYTDGAGNVATITPSQNAILFDGYYPGTPTHPFGPTNNINGSGISGYANIIQGVYTAWGYEHYLYAASLGTGSLKTVADQIATQLTSEADFGGVGMLLSAMNASRATDGAPITSP
jgi:hypothetical protein